MSSQQPETTAPEGALTAIDQSKIITQSIEQLRTSRNFKRARMKAIKENEDLYAGIVEPSVRNPFNECFPFMAGFVDHLRAKIDDDSNLTFVHQDEADLKKANKVNAFWDMESKSVLPTASWSLKHRHAKFNAIFSGRAIYKYYAESNPVYKSCLDVISHYDFHNEPRGGAILENHLFCGQDNIFKNKEEIEDNDDYDRVQVLALTTKTPSATDNKQNNDVDATRNNRYIALGEDPTTNNYVGQGVYKFVEWYTTYKSKRYYVLFEEQSSVWIRMCPLKDIFPDELWPYVSWATNEDPDMFWSKAPADDAKPVAKVINTFINQELYNRQKRNQGQRGYDADMFPNLKALADWRPDGLVPVDTKTGTRPISTGIYEFKVGDLNGTLDMVTWIEQFTGKQLGYTSASAGQSEKDKKVGVFQGEVQQVDQLINVKNKSFQLAVSQLGLLFKQGLEHNLTTEQAIKIMGAHGIEWTTISPDDLKFERDLVIQPVGGTSELQLKKLQDNEKFITLQELAKNQASGVNPQWLSREMLLLKGYDEQAINDAFSQDNFGTKELMSEASQAEKDIVEGKKPKLNRGANASFMQHIVDFATDTEELSLEVYNKLMDYAMAHTEIAVENESKNIKDIIRKRRMAVMGQNAPAVDNAGLNTVKAPAPTLSTATPQA